MVKLLAEPAPAKINLFLRVVGRRADGYHELDSVFVPVSLCDQVRVEIRVEPRSAADTTIALHCDRDDLPAGEKNLAWRAADTFLGEFGAEIHRPREVAIDLRKEIPIGAGLGGGSSDAGAVLRMMAALCRVDDPSRLARVALALGADVPFFLDPHVAHVGGVGERIAPLEIAASGERAPLWRTLLWMVIAVPPVEVSTKEVFRALSLRTMERRRARRASARDRLGRDQAGDAAKRPGGGGDGAISGNRATAVGAACGRSEGCVDVGERRRGLWNFRRRERGCSSRGRNAPESSTGTILRRKFAFLNCAVRRAALPAAGRSFPQHRNLWNLVESRD